MADLEDRDRLIHILESSLEVRRSSQFFAWTQGPLQSLLPHEILICAAAGQGDGNLQLRYYSAVRYFRQEHFEIACHPRTGIIPKMIQHWRMGRSPCQVPPAPDGEPVDPAWPDILERLELKTMAAHGLLSPGGGIHAWFGLFRVPPADPRQRFFLDLLVPSLSAAYSRVLSQENAPAVPSVKMARLLTPRETQVLELLRDGLSNTEIGDRLTVSVMTAKNHVQNIRAKLKARNRSQAVTEAIRLGLIRAERSSDGQ
ncbi:MAG: XrtB/PEP-CTERM-associated transcriptional regulator EpsA [Pseudomonadota bacterium]